MVLLALGVIVVSPLPACGPGPWEGEAAFAGGDQLACFSWSEADDPYFVPVLASEDDLSARYDGQNTELDGQMDTWTRDWSAYLGLGSSSESLDTVRSMLSDDDPVKVFRQKVLPKVPRDVAGRSRDVEGYLALMARAGSLDAAAAPWNQDLSPQEIAKGWGQVFKEASTAQGRSSLPAFLQSRYDYLVLRAATQTGSPQRALDLYQAAFSRKPASLLRYKAWSYAARASIQLGNTTQAAQWYLAILDQFPALQFATVESLGALNLDDSDWDSLIASLPAGHRRAFASFARALFDPHVETTRYMEAMDAEEPGSPQMAKLLIRSLRAIDQMRLPRLLAGYAAPGAALSKTVVAPSGPGAAAMDDQKVMALRDFVRQVIARDKEWNPGLWHAASAHLALLLGSTADAAAALDAAKPREQKFSQSGRGALAIERMLTALALARPDEDLQALIPDARAAVDLIAKTGDTTPREAVFGALGLKRLADGDAARATLDFSLAGYAETVRFMLDMYLEPSDLSSLEQLIASPPDAESTAAAAQFAFNADALEYMRGVRLLRSGSFDEAAKTLGALPASFWKSGPKKSDAIFDDQFARTPMFSVTVADGDTNDPAVKARVMRKDALAKRLADLARAGDSTRLGWMYLSTPYIGYNDLLWNGEMIEVLKRASLDGGWPFVTKELATQAEGRLAVFFDEYDSNGIASRFLKKSLDREKATEKAARLALGLWQSLTGSSYAESAGSPSAKAVADANGVAALLAKQYGRTSTVKGYRASFDDGCPGLDATR
jgi:hypothetical protein